MKKELSKMESTERVSPFKDKNGRVANKQFKLTRTEFVKLSKNEFDKIPALIRDLSNKIKKLNMDIRDVDECILAGGLSNIP